MVLARRCRGSDIYRICLADRNQWLCPVSPHPRPTSFTPGPAHRACLAVYRIPVSASHPTARDITHTITDVCARPNRRPRSVTARYQRPAGCLGSPGIPAGPGGPTPPLPPLFTWPRGPRMAQNSSKHVPAPQKWPSCARQKLILTAPLLNPSRWIGQHVSPPAPRLTLASGTLKLAGSNVRRGGGRARFIHLLGLRRGCVSLVAWGAKKMVVISAIAQGVEWIWERQNW